MGIEPTTFSLPWRCSTDWATPALRPRPNLGGTAKSISWEWESNPRPSPYHGDALPTELPQHLCWPLQAFCILAKRAMGIEPTYQAWKASVLPLNYARARHLLYYIKKSSITKGFWSKNPAKNGPQSGAFDLLYKKEINFAIENPAARTGLKRWEALSPTRGCTQKRAMVALPYG